MLITAAPAAFLASSVWYSPLLFGLQFAALSGVNSNTASNGGKIGLAFRADFVLAVVLDHFFGVAKITGRMRALLLGAWLWIGFPVVL